MTILDITYITIGIIVGLCVAVSVIHNMNSGGNSYRGRWQSVPNALDYFIGTVLFVISTIAWPVVLVIVIIMLLIRFIYGRFFYTGD